MTATTSSQVDRLIRPRNGGALPVFRRTLADGWRGLIGWALGLAIAIFIYLPLFPSITSPDMSELIDSLPAELTNTLGFGQIATGAGYVQAMFFGLIGFVLLTIAAVGWGSAAIAGAEESGRLELTLAHGVGRAQYALESALAIVVKLLVLGAFAALLIIALDESAQLGLDVGNLVATTTAAVGLALLTATAGLAIGAISGRRGWALGIAAGVAVLGYGLNALGNQTEDLDWLHRLSPYDWAFGTSPLVNGIDGGGLGLLWGGSALLVVVATLALRRRDVLG